MNPGYFVVKYVLLAAFIGLLAFGAITLFTAKGSRARAWIIATPDRIGFVGVATLLVIWVGFVVFNRATGS